MTDVIEPVEVNEVEPTPSADQPNSVDLPEVRLVPVTEAIRYRKRAQAAEQQLDSTRTKLSALQNQFDQVQQMVADLERRQRIDALLAESDVIDLDAARLLTERAVSQMDEPDVKLAVEDLRRCKPYLFRRSHSAHAMSAAVEDLPPHAEHAAAEARATGDRRDLLRYLRLRRNR